MNWLWMWDAGKSQDCFKVYVTSVHRHMMGHLLMDHFHDWTEVYTEHVCEVHLFWIYMFTQVSSAETSFISIQHKLSYSLYITTQVRVMWLWERLHTHRGHSVWSLMSEVPGQTVHLKTSVHDYVHRSYMFVVRLLNNMVTWTSTVQTPVIPVSRATSWSDQE